MHGTCWCRLALGLVFCGVAAGCRSLPSPPSPLDGGLVSCSPLPPDRERAAQAHALYSLGVHHEMADEYDLAHEAYRQAAEFDPDNERLVLRMASTLVLQRKTEEALRTVEDFLSRQPSSEKALLWLATFYGSTGDQSRVLQLFRQMTDEFPANPLGWLQLAAATADQTNDAEVIAVLEAGLEKAQPATALRQELARLHLGQMQAVQDPELQRRERQLALDQLRRIVQDVPGDADTLHAMAELLARDGQFEEAVQVYEKIERIQPGDPKTKQQLARTFLAMNHPDKAIALLEGMAQDPAKPSNVHYALAELYLQTGDKEKAATHFRSAATASTNDPTPWLRLAGLQAEHNESQAIATLAEGLAAMPGNPKLLEVMALIRLGQHRYSQAEQLMRQVWESSSQDASQEGPSNLFFYNFATVCTHLRKIQEAAEWLRKAAEQEPAAIELFVQRAMTGTATFRKSSIRVLRELGDQPGAQLAAIHVHLATLLLSQDDAAPAVKDFEKALAIVESDPLQADALSPRFYFWFGVALDQSGQTDRAVETFESCIRLDPGYADALNYLAYLWAGRGIRLDEALRHVQAALALDPDNPAYLDTLGWIYYQQERYSEALELLLQADALRPNDPEILDHVEKTRLKLER